MFGLQIFYLHEPKNWIFWFDFSLQSPFFRTMLIRKALVSTLTVCNLRMVLTADSPFSLNCKVVHVWIVVSFGSTLKLHWYIFNQNKIDSFPATVLFLLLMIVLSSVIFSWWPGTEDSVWGTSQGMVHPPHSVPILGVLRLWSLSQSWTSCCKPCLYFKIIDFT